MNQSTSPCGQAWNTAFQDYANPNAIDDFVNIIRDPKTPDIDIYTLICNIKFCNSTVRRPFFLLFAGEESLEVVRAVDEIAQKHLCESPQVFSYENEDELEKRASTQRIEHVKNLLQFVDEGRTALWKAVQFCHAPHRVQSLQVTPRCGLSTAFEDTKTGERIAVSFHSDQIVIKCRRTIDEALWTSEKTIYASQNTLDRPIELTEFSPSQSLLAREKLPTLQPKFIERSVDDCPWREKTDYDGYKINYTAGCVCLELAGTGLPLLSRKEIHERYYQNATFAPC